MNPTTAINWAIGVSIALLLAAAPAVFKEIPDNGHEHASALALKDAQAAAAQEERKQTEAYNVCKSDHGPNVVAAWNFDGALICQPKRGPARIVTAHSAIK